MSIINYFVNNAKMFPDNPALWIEGRYYSYQTIYHFALRLAFFLKQTTAPQCILLGSKSLTMYVGILAALTANKTYVPINTLSPFVSNKKILSVLEADSLIIDRNGLSQAKSYLAEAKETKLILFPDLAEIPAWCIEFSHHRYICKTDIDQISTSDFNIQGQPNPHAALLFTSGTTGFPKGIRLSHLNIQCFLSDSLSHYALSSNDRFTQLFDFTFDPAILEIFGCWSAGGCLYSVNDSIFYRFSSFLDQHKITFLCIVPSLLSYILNMKSKVEPQLEQLRYTLFGGEILSTCLASKWQKVAPHSIIENCYGPTEACIAVTRYQFLSTNQILSDQVPIGMPFGNNVVALLNENLESTKEGEVGMIYLSGPQLAEGYWNNPEITLKNFLSINLNGKPERWFKTGDLASWNSQYGFDFKGRVDDQMQIRGCRIEKIEIENALCNLAETTEVAVVGWPSSKEGNLLGLVAFVCHSKVSIKELIMLCKSSLPYYLIPNRIIFLKKLPLTTNKKINYKKLLAMLEVK